MNFCTMLIKTLFSAIFIFSSFLHAEFITITSEDQFNNLLNEKKPLILKFTGKYCAPCTITKAPFEKVSKEKEFKDIGFIELDVQSPVGGAISSEFKIVGVPTFIYIRDGKEIKRIVGVQHPANFAEDLRKKISNILLKKQDDEITSIEVKEEFAAPRPTEEEEEVPSQATQGALARLWLSMKAFFIFILDKIKEAIKFFIDLIKKIFGK